MLDLMRKHAGTWLIKVILGAVIIVFTFWGIGSYRMRKGSRVAVVNGTTINVDQYREAYNRILEQLRQRFGNNLNDEMIKMFNVRGQALNSVIDQALLIGEARRLKFRVADEELAAAIRNAPAFQNNGRFDVNRYRRVLDANRMTPESFEIMQRETMLIEKLRSMISGSVIVSEAEAREWYDWRNASVNIDYVLFKSGKYEDIQPTPEEIAAYFKDNSSAYKTEPLRKVRYLHFDPAAYQEKVSITEDEISEYYEANPAEYKVPKTVEASHILIRAGADDSDEKVESSRKRALEILKKIRDGEDFAEAAKKYSEGPSKENGGHLGAFRKEAMVAPFAEKAFSMKAGEISEPVRTAFGWHLIKVEKINPESTVSLAEAASSIRKKLTEDRSKNLAYDDAEAAYEVSFDDNDLDKIAESRGIEVRETDFFGSEGPRKGVKNAADFARFAFAQRVGEISDVQEIGNDYYMLWVVEEIAEKIPELEAVSDRVKQDLIKKMQKEKAQEDARSFLKAVKNGRTMAEAGKTFGVAPTTTGWFNRTEPIPGIGHQPALAAEAFKLSAAKPFPENVIEGGEGYYIARAKERKSPAQEGFGREKSSIMQSLVRQKESAVFNALLADLKGESEITVAEEYRE